MWSSYRIITLGRIIGYRLTAIDFVNLRIVFSCNKDQFVTSI